MEKKKTEPSFFQRAPFSIWGLFGTLIIGLCSLITAIIYTGAAGQDYNLLNHFISELGEVGVSELAWLFNFGLIVGGFSLCLFMIGLGVYINNKISKIAMIVGVSAAIACMCVGIFPMNHLNSHMIAAFSFFYGGMVAIAIYAIAILKDKNHKIPKAFGYLGFVVVASFASFLFLPSSLNDTAGISLDPSQMNRPEFWLLTFLEWLILFTVLGWILAISGYQILKKEDSNP